jgi:hypothetical protein
MNKTFLQFNDTAVASGLLHHSPELARELKRATEQFILFAKSAGSSSDEHSDSELEEVPLRRTSTKQHDVQMVIDQQTTFSNSSASPEPVNANQSGVDIGMGYIQIFDDVSSSLTTPPVDPSMDAFNTAMQMDNSPEMERYDGAMENFALLQYSTASAAADLVALAAPTNFSSQQYNVQMPSPPPVPIPSPTKSMTLAAPYTYSFQETTFARRLQRAALERGFHLLSNAELRPQAYNRVFKLSLLYHTRDMLLAKFRKALAKSVEEPLETYQTPFIHLGGAGMHYQTGRIKNGYIVKPGPLMRQATLQSADAPGVTVDIEFDLSEYEGEWFDSNDVEGYLEEQGLHIDPQSTFAEGKVQAEVTSPQSRAGSPTSIFSRSPSASGMETTTATSITTSPQTPVLSETTLELGTARLFPELGGWEASAWDNTATGWLMGSGDKTPDFITSGWQGVDNPASWDFADSVGLYNDYGSSHLADPAAVVDTTSSTNTNKTASAQTQKQKPAKKSVTIDVSKLIDGESSLSHVVQVEISNC